MTTPPDARSVAEAYLAAWNETDDGRRRILLAEGWAPEATYLDPLMRGDGLEGIARMIEAARARFPGHRFVPAGVPDGHNDLVRFSWHLMPAGGPAVGAGTDVVRLDDQGRIAAVMGFLDRAPA